MNNNEVFNILAKSWSKQRFLMEIKKGKSSEEIVQEFIKENKNSINSVIKLINEKDRNIIHYMETLNNCETQLINKLKEHDLISNINKLEKSIKKESILNFHKEFSLTSFMNKWSNKFVIGSLIMISIISLTKQAWA